ncbi:hypothetical protein B0H13DRAFT_1882605 [Mycena leptocephala]|nr:hypothetical protein B0H13DRAFT_1882605 [Mycena leptocephala]
MTDAPTIQDDGEGRAPEVTDTPTIHDDGQGRAPAAETRGAEENAGPLSQSGSQATPESPESSATTPMVQFGPEPLPQGSIISEKGDVYTPPARPAIVQRGKPTRTKRRAGEAAAKPGKPGWVWGTKLTFFENRKDAWVKASENKNAGDFYSKMAKLYTAKYGFELADDEDFEVDVADPPDWVADKVVNVRLSAEETKMRQDTHTKLRERLGQWYRGQYGSILKAEKTSFGELFSSLGRQEKPRRQQLLHFYSGRHWETRIKPRVEARLAGLKRRAEYTGEAVPAAITIQNEETKACWDEESPVFQEAMKRELERDYEITLKGWKESLADSPARTAEEYNTLGGRRSLKTAAAYLQPWCDAVAERYGMCVLVLICGPIGERDGRIEMRSVHAGTTRGLVENDWPRHDPQGFSVVEAKMVEFAHNVFTINIGSTTTADADCEARKTAEQVLEAPPSTGTSARESAVAGGAARGGSGSTMSGRTTAAVQGGAAAIGAATTITAAAHVGPTPESRGADNASATAPGTTAQGGGDDNGLDREGVEGAGEGGADGGQAMVQATIERCWQRKDRPKWSEELARAHGAFERIKEWGGIEWAGCVERFYDFESKFGFTEEGSQITKQEWPEVVMASLLWWGEAVTKTSPFDRLDWAIAVDDVAWVLEEMVRPGVIKRNIQTTKEAGKGKKRKTVDEDVEAVRRGRSGGLSLRDWVTWVGGELGDFSSNAEVAMANWYNDGQIKAAEIALMGERSYPVEQKPRKQTTEAVPKPGKQTAREERAQPRERINGRTGMQIPVYCQQRRKKTVGTATTGTRVQSTRILPTAPEKNSGHSHNGNPGASTHILPTAPEKNNGHSHNGSPGAKYPHIAYSTGKKQWAQPQREPGCKYPYIAYSTGKKHWAQPQGDLPYLPTH